MKIKVYEIPYGNGWLGSKTNMGKVLVAAESVKEAKEKLSKRYNVKLGHMSAATRVDVLV